MSSPTSTGIDSSSRGGSVSGEITSPMFVNTVRNHGNRRRSPSSNPTSTGRDVSDRGGSFSGANLSRTLVSKDFHKGCVNEAGGRRSIESSEDRACESSGYHASAALER